MKCKIATLTPCHIGAGQKLIKDIDFVVGKIGEDEYVGVVEPEKIFALLGETGIDRWCSAIERKESIWKVVKTQKQNVTLDEISGRTLLMRGRDSTQLHVHITTNGVPYIPGSSIKGAIVSAIVGESRDTLHGLEEKSVEKLLVKSRERTYPPHNSNLRFLRVGDAYFGDADMVAVDTYSLNLRKKGSLIDRSVGALVECINYDNQSVVDIQLQHDLHRACRDSVLPLPEAMRSEEALLRAINRHTLRLLNEELQFWQKQKTHDYYHIDTDEEYKELAYYLDQINLMCRACASCRDGNEAVLRIGYGSGWRFMTGGWIGLEDSRLAEVAARIRRNASYEKYDFPKTRRVGYRTPFGFVKLTKQ